MKKKPTKEEETFKKRLVSSIHFLPSERERDETRREQLSLDLCLFCYLREVYGVDVKQIRRWSFVLVVQVSRRCCCHRHSTEVLSFFFFFFPNSVEMFGLFLSSPGGWVCATRLRRSEAGAAVIS